MYKTESIIESILGGHEEIGDDVNYYDLFNDGVKISHFRKNEGDGYVADCFCKISDANRKHNVRRFRVYFTSNGIKINRLKDAYSNGMTDAFFDIIISYVQKIILYCEKFKTMEDQ